MAQAATYVTRNEHNRWTSMPSVGSEPVIPATEWLQIYALRLWSHQDQPKNIYSGNTRCHDNDRLINEYIITTNVVKSVAFSITIILQWYGMVMCNEVSTCFDSYGANVCLLYALQGFINVSCNLLSTHKQWFTVPMSYISAVHATRFYYKYEQVCVIIFHTRNICNSIVKPTRRTSFSNLFYFGITLYMFQMVFQSIIRSSRLYVQQNRYWTCLLAGTRWNWVPSRSR
jgi:hypothetical protein